MSFLEPFLCFGWREETDRAKKPCENYSLGYEIYEGIWSGMSVVVDTYIVIRSEHQEAERKKPAHERYRYPADIPFIKLKPGQLHIKSITNIV